MNYVRKTPQRTLVLAYLLADPTCPRYAGEVAEATGLYPGTVYTILSRLVQTEWLTKEAEPGDPGVLGRPLRNYVLLTARGIEGARALSPPGPARTVQPRWYRIVSGPVGIGAVIMAIQYTGTRDTLDGIARMLGMGALQVGGPLPPLHVNERLVEIQDWVTYAHGHADALSPLWFSEHYRLADPDDSTDQNHGGFQW